MQSDQTIRPANFAIIGAGFIFDRHLAAIEHVGGKLLAVVDSDNAKEEKLDSGVEFYGSYNELKNKQVYVNVDTVVICTPNWTHYELARVALEDGKNVLCEKPAVISSEQLDGLREAEAASRGELFFVHQLRTSQKLKELRDTLQTATQRQNVEVDLKMHRGDFYWEGWKGKEELSGGILFNIGVHYIDLLVWLFGEPEDVRVSERTDKKAKVFLRFEKAVCNFELDLTVAKDKQSRVIRITNEKLNLTRILESLHNKVYEQLIELKGTSVDDVAPTIRLCEQLTNSRGD